MKEITKDNIDYWIFEFLEGSLSLEQSDRLLSVIGRNPEFQEEFNYWQEANYKNEPLPESSDLVRSLQKDTLWENKWLHSAVISGIVGLLVYFTTINLMDKNLTPNEIQQSETKTTIQEVVPATGGNVDERADNKITSDNIKNVGNQNERLIISTNGNSENNSLIETSENTKTESHENNVMNSESPLHPETIESQKKDTIRVMLDNAKVKDKVIVKEIEKAEIANIKKEHSRRSEEKMKKQLKPADEVIKVNPNF